MSQYQTPQITRNGLIRDMRNQARWLFWIAILGIGTCIVIYTIGATALVLGKTSIGVFTTITSSLSILPYVYIAKISHNWLKVANEKLYAQETVN